MIADEIRQLAGKKNKSADWYINALENALSPVQDPDISTSDTGWVESRQFGVLFIWCKVSEKYEYWDLQPLAFVLEFYKDGFLGANLHYVNPDYRDGLAKTLINSGRGQVYQKFVAQISLFWSW